MRFTIRHLLWFTLLAAVGCWWWLPSANDARDEGTWLAAPDRDRRIESQATFESYPPSCRDGPNEPVPVDFKIRDAITVNCFGPDWPVSEILLRNRANGQFVLVGHFTPGRFFGARLISVSKGAYVFRVTSTQANLIDGSIAALLVLSAAGSLLLGRKSVGCLAAQELDIVPPVH